MHFVWEQRLVCTIVVLLGIWCLDIVYAVNESQKDELKIPPAHKPVALNNLAPIRLPQLPEILEVQTIKTVAMPIETIANPTLGSKVSLAVKPQMFEKAHPKSELSREGSVAIKSKLDESIKKVMGAGKHKAILKQLAELDRNNIQFLLPQGSAAKEAFLSHMYRCEGMQFGAITQQIPNRLTVLSAKKASNRTAGQSFQASELLRVAHDYLSTYERNLLTVYGQGKQAVRIFPVELDANLSAQIALHLGDIKLNSFEAMYFLKDSRVGLRQIIINKKAVPDTWFISSAGCY